MSTFKLSILKPCHESWEGMAPDAQGRFCGQCQKTVTDFTGMTGEQVKTYMLLNDGKKVCGRFEVKQLQPVPFIPKIPRSVLFSQTSFRKMFLLALFITMGTTLFSCRNEVMGEPAVVDDEVQATAIDTTKHDNVTAGKIENTDSIVKAGKKVTPLPPPVKYEQPMLLGEPAVVPDTIAQK